MHAAKVLVGVVAAVLIVIAAAGLRVGDLGDRPMHGDEAVNTFKFQELYEDNAYRYDPSEYHGPTLPYLTWLAAAIHPATAFADFPAEMYRGVTVAFGVGLVVLTVLIGAGIGYPAALFAALLVAVSPAMTFYSRYYIHEMPLVVFTAVAILVGWRYAVTGRLAWAVALGVALGLMHATKETAIIAWFAAGVATIALLVAEHRRSLSLETARSLAARHVKPAGLALAAWAVVAVVLFSSFFTHARGPLDSVLTFLSYIDRGTGGEPMHVHPWHYYLSLLAWHRPVEPLIWTEALTLSLATVGVLAAAIGRGISPAHLPLVRWLAVFTLTLIAVYSLIPYKTPWNVLGFLHGIMLLAGVGAVVLAWSLPRAVGAWLTPQRWPAVALPLGLLILVPIGWGTWQLSEQTALTTDTRFNADRRNPWVYAHPSRRVAELGDRLDEMASIHPQGFEMPVQIYDAGNYWPVPWYLRRLERVGYFPHLPTENVRGPVILIEAHMDDEARLWDRLEDTHSGPHYVGVRPDHTLAMYVEKDLWDAYIDRRR